MVDTDECEFVFSSHNEFVLVIQLYKKKKKSNCLSPVTLAL